MNMQAATAPGRFAKDSLTEAGRAAGDAIETYSKNKQRSEMLDGQIGTILMNMTPEQQAQLENNPIGKTLKKFVNQDLSLSGKESLLGSLAIDMQMDAQRRQTDQQDWLFNRQKAEHEAIKRFNQRSTGMIPNPEVEKIDAEIEQEQLGLNRVMDAPPTVSASGIPAPSQDHLAAGFRARIKALEESKEALDSQIPMMAADGQTFVDRYGTPTSPEEAQLVREDYIRRQTAKAPKGGYTVDIQHPDGTPHTYRMYDDGSRRYIGPAPAQGREYMSVDEQLAVYEQKGLSEANVARLTELDKNLRASIDTADTARNALATLTRLPDDAKTGGFTESINEIQKYLNSAGFDFDPETLRRIGNTEQFMQQTGEFLFDSIAETKGSISNAEMAIFRSINPGMRQSRLGNQLMLEFIATAGERAKRKLRYKQDLEADALSSREMVRALDEFDKLPRNKITQILDPIIGDGGQSASPSAPRSGARQVPQGGGVFRTSGGGTFTPR